MSGHSNISILKQMNKNYKTSDLIKKCLLKAPICETSKDSYNKN